MADPNPTLSQTLHVFLFVRPPRSLGSRQHLELQKIVPACDLETELAPVLQRVRDLGVFAHGGSATIEIRVHVEPQAQPAGVSHGL